MQDTTRGAPTPVRLVRTSARSGERGVRNGVGRYYDPTTGQFLTIDPLVDQTGRPYAYAAGDPVIENDPLGLCCSLTGALEFVHDASGYIAGGSTLLSLVTSPLASTGVGAAVPGFFASVALSASAVNVATGIALNQLGKESNTELALDTAGLALGGLSKLAGQAAETASEYAEAVSAYSEDATEAAAQAAEEGNLARAEVLSAAAVDAEEESSLLRAFATQVARIERTADAISLGIAGYEFSQSGANQQKSLQWEEKNCV
jgi:RHS repeat-associated protein